MITCSKKTLPNGLRLVAVEMPHLHSAEIAFYVKVGGRNDPKGKPAFRISWNICCFAAPLNIRPRWSWKLPSSPSAERQCLHRRREHLLFHQASSGRPWREHDLGAADGKHGELALCDEFAVAREPRKISALRDARERRRVRRRQPARPAHVDIEPGVARGHLDVEGLAHRGKHSPQCPRPPRSTQ